MDSPDPSGPFPFANPRQKYVYERLLNNIGPGPAAFFLDACRIMGSPEGLGTTTHIVAHCLREIESALRDVLAGRSVDRKTEESAADVVREILRSLDISEDEDIARVWIGLHKAEGQQLHGKAHRRGLRVPRPVDRDFQDYWKNIQRVLDAVLDRFETRSNETFRALDDLLEIEAPTRDDVRYLSDYLPNNLVTRAYFFQCLRHPAWLAPLRRKNFFRSPPRSYRDPLSGEIRMPPWPETEYLKAMAPEMPADVVEIILQMAETENVRVRQSLVEVAGVLPGPFAAQLAHLVISWIDRHDDLLLLNERAKDYTIHLSAEGLVDGALNVAESLLKLSPDEGRSSLLSPRPRARMSAWHYNKTLNEIGEAIGEKVPGSWLEMLTDLLDEAMRLSTRESSVNAPPEDFSNIWRPAIEPHDQNTDHEDPAEALVTAVRDYAGRVIQEQELSLTEVLNLLRAKDWKIFRRICLYLAAKHDRIDSDTLRTLILDRDLFDDVTVHHEYYSLLRTHFQQLGKEDQEVFMSWIEQGPDQDKVRRWLTTGEGEEPDEGALDERIDRWRHRKLLPISDALSPEWHDRLRDYEERFGELNHPDFHSYSTGVWVGPTSPQTAEELSALDIEEIARLLREWEPSDDWESPTPEGLGRTLTEVVCEDPQRFSENMRLFLGLDPTYARSIARGFQDALKRANSFDWEPVMGFAQDIVEHPRSLEDERTNARDRDSDPHWGWARRAVGSLLWTGLAAETSLRIPFHLRAVVWEVIENLLEDPDPTPEHEAKYGGANMDPATMSINTVRGTAMHAAINYGLWVRQNSEVGVDPSTGETNEFVGSRDAPEVFAILDERLGVDREPAASVRAVYGQWLPTLVWLDEGWARGRVGRIFERDDGRLWDAAWNTYVWANRPKELVFKILQDEYAHAVTRLASGRMDTHGFRGRPEENLAAHIMTLYWWGVLDLSDDGLVQQFFRGAPAQTRGYALKFVGRSLGSLEEDPTSDTAARLKALWELRREAAERASVREEHADEMAAFIWWLRSARLDPAWTLEEVRRGIELADGLGHDAWFALDALVELAAQFPEKTVVCLSKLVIHDRDLWVTAARKEEMREVLQISLAHGGAAASTARDTVNRLIGRGYLDFRDLLD